MKLANKPSDGIALTADNSKKFASRLKKALEKENLEVKIAQCYEILARTFGSSNWHEMSVHLSGLNELKSQGKDDINLNSDISDTNIVTKNQDYDVLHNEDIPCLFKLNWIEFNFFINQSCNCLNINFETTQIIKSLLLMVKDQNYKNDNSYLNKEGLKSLLKNLVLKEMLEDRSCSYINKFNCSDEIKQIVRTNFSEYRKENGINGNYDSNIIIKNDIMNFLNFVLFLMENNTLLKKEHHVFENNSTIKYDHLKNESLEIRLHNKIINSDNSFINNILVLIQIAQEKVYLHDLFIYLFLKRDTFNRIRYFYTDSDEEKHIDKYTDKLKVCLVRSIYENKDYCEYGLKGLNLIEENYISYDESTITIHIKNLTDDIRNVLSLVCSRELNIKTILFEFEKNVTNTQRIGLIQLAIGYIDSNIEFYINIDRNGVRKYYVEEINSLKIFKGLFSNAEVVNS